MPISLVEGGKTFQGLPVPEELGQKSTVEKNALQMEHESRTVLLEAKLDNSKKSSDQAVLSKESRDHHKEAGGITSKREHWNLETDPLWPYLLTWYPDSGKTTEQMIVEILDLYRALLANLMNNTTGQDQHVQLVRLEQMLSQVLNRIWDQQLGDMSLLFTDFGTKEQISQIKSEIYRMITGQRLGKQDTDHFWQMGSITSKDLSRNTRLSEGDVSGKNVRAYYQTDKNGQIYQLAKGKSNREVVLSSSVKAQTSMENDKIVNNVKVVMEGNLGGEINGVDLKLANQVAKYLTSPDNVLRWGEVTGKSEELQGVMASILQIQSREFMRYSGMGNTMSNLIDDVIDRMIDRHFRQEASLLDRKTMVDGQKQISAFRLKDAYGVYNYVINLHQKYWQPDRAISEGIRYAMELFAKKQSDESLKKVTRYGEDVAFFQKIQGNNIHSSFWIDVRYGKAMIEKNWAMFLAYTGMIGKKQVSLIPLDQSFWGSLINPEETNDSSSFRSYLVIFTGILCFGLVLLLFFRFF